MRSLTIRVFLLVLTHALFAVSAAFGGSDGDACVQDEKQLRAEEADLCSSMGYLFNPSACIKARKALIRHESGKCRSTAAGEAVEPGKPMMEQSPPAQSLPQINGGTSSTAVINTQVPARGFSVSTETDSLRREIEEMKSELRMLRQEIERLQGKK